MISDSKVHGANMWPIRGRQGPGGPRVGPMNFAIWDMFCEIRTTLNTIGWMCFCSNITSSLVAICYIYLFIICKVLMFMD